LKHTVYLGLGSNIEPRLVYLHNAVDALRCELTELRVSSIYETEPWGFVDQARFLNCVITGNTELSAVDLLHRSKKIEHELGRRPTFKNGPRVIDIDILVYDQVQIQTEELTIPHPHLLERGFVLIPLRELADDLLIPGTDLTVAGAVKKCGTLQGVNRISEDESF
jgi:2-amino-4-hydroxy-6-hydroxymethyldihydropteridine diphosphokinase